MVGSPPEKSTLSIPNDLANSNCLKIDWIDELHIFLLE
jgi:hypothetical protein